MENNNENTGTTNNDSGSIPVNTVVYDSNEGYQMTMEESRILGQISYLDFKSMGIDPTGKTVETVLLEVQEGVEDGKITIPSNGGLSQKDYMEQINNIVPDEDPDTIEKHQNILNLEYTGYTNNNVSKNDPNGSGLVMAALTPPNGGNTIILATGSEGGADSKVSKTIFPLTPDWISNGLFGAGKGDPIIEAEIAEFCKVNTNGEPVFFLGHSRGYVEELVGADALLKAGYDPSKIKIVGLSGFSGTYSFTPEQIARLNALNPMNYVVEGDVVGYIGPNIGQILVFKKADYIELYTDTSEGDVKLIYRNDGSRPYNKDNPDKIYYDKYGNEIAGKSGTGFGHYLPGIYIDGEFYQLAEQSFWPIFAQNLTSRIIAKNPPYIDELLGKLAGIETPLQRERAEAKAKEDGLKYVVKGAKLKCNMGLRTSKLLMPKTNGVYIHDLPQADEFNNKKENIISFAGCCSTGNPNTVKANKKITDKVNNRPKDSTDTMMNVVVAFTGLKEKFLRKNEKDRMCASYGKCDFYADKHWITVKENVYLTNDKALLRKSLLGCRYGGTISIIHEGQLE